MTRALLLIALLAPVASAAAPERVRFVIRCVEERAAVQRTIYQATIDAPAATDFTIRIRDAGYRLDADFTNELVAGGIDTRIRLGSARRDGTSRNDLPLWEEDEQRHRFHVRFGDAITLLPFGRAGAKGLLKIEVRPERAAASSAPIAIRIDTPGAGGTISVDAYRLPHWYRVDAGSATHRVFAGEPLRLGTTTLTVTAAAHQDPWKCSEVEVRNARAVTCGGDWLPLPGMRVRIQPEGTP